MSKACFFHHYFLVNICLATSHSVYELLPLFILFLFQQISLCRLAGMMGREKKQKKHYWNYISLSCLSFFLILCRNKNEYNIPSPIRSPVCRSVRPQRNHSYSVNYFMHLDLCMKYAYCAFLFFQFHIFVVLIEKICLCYLSSLYKILYVLFKGVLWSMSNICASITHTLHITR